MQESFLFKETYEVTVLEEEPEKTFLPLQEKEYPLETNEQKKELSPDFLAEQEILSENLFPSQPQVLPKEKSISPSPVASINSEKSFSEKADKSHALKALETLIKKKKTKSSSFNFFDQAGQVVNSYKREHTPEVFINEKEWVSKALEKRGIKEHSYKRQIIEKLIVSFNTLKQKLPYPPRSIARAAALHIEILSDGKLSSCALMSSSGSYLFDDLLLKSVQKAAPFPPIPSHLGVSTYVVTGTIELPA